MLLLLLQRVQLLFGMKNAYIIGLWYLAAVCCGLKARAHTVAQAGARPANGIVGKHVVGQQATAAAGRQQQQRRRLITHYTNALHDENRRRVEWALRICDAIRKFWLWLWLLTLTSITRN